MSDGYAGKRRRRDSRADPWADLKRYSALLQRQRLFSAPAKDEWIAAFESHDVLTGQGKLYEQVVDAVLWDRVVTWALAHVNAPCSRRRKVEDFHRDESVVDYDRRGFQTLPTANGDKPRVARAGANQRDGVRHLRIGEESM